VISTTRAGITVPRPPGRFPTNATACAADPEKYGDFSNHYKWLHSQRPGFQVGIYSNPYRNGESIYLADDSDRFGALMFPTRTGKGISFSIPNSFRYLHSLYNNDPKKENFYYTAWWRRHMLGQRIFLIDPYDTTGQAAAINMMDEVRVKTLFEIQDALNLSTAVVDPDGKGMADPKEGVWKKRARDLLAGVILHILWCPEFHNKSLKTVIDFLTDTSAPLDKKLKMMTEYPHDPEQRYGWRLIDGTPTRTHPFLAAKVQQQINRPAQEGGSVQSEAESYLGTYQDYLAAINTTRSDFSFGDLMDSPIPASVYMGINPENSATATPFTRLFFNYLINRNLCSITPDPITGRPIVDHTWKMGMILDEFTSSYGKLDLFVNQLAYIAGYGFKPYIIVQDMQQIKETYGALENISSNTQTTIFGMMGNLDSAEYFSKRMNNRTLAYYTHGSSMSAGMGPGTSRTETTDSRPLLFPNEISELREDESITLVHGHKPIPTHKLRFFREDSSYAHKVVPFKKLPEDVSDRIPYSEQRSHQTRARDEMQFLEYHRNLDRNRLTAVGNVDNIVNQIDQQAEWLKSMRDWAPVAS
jgi:type IV secretion system protein VirD4